MDFSEAIRQAKNGHKVTRPGMRDEGSYLIAKSDRIRVVTSGSDTEDLYFLSNQDVFCDDWRVIEDSRELESSNAGPCVAMRDTSLAKRITAVARDVLRHHSNLPWDTGATELLTQILDAIEKELENA